MIDRGYKRQSRTATAQELGKIRREVIKGSCKNPEVAVLSAHELQRMKQEAKILTKSEREAQRKIMAEQLETQQAEVMAKRKRMQTMDELRLKTAPPLSDLEKEDLEKATSLKNRAEEIYNENRDEVKKMNQIVGLHLSR